MNLLDLRLILSSVTLYFAATVLLALETFASKTGLGPLRSAAVVLGFIVHTAGIVGRGILAEEIPLTGLFEYVSFLSWAIVFVYLVFFRKRLPLVGSLTVLTIVLLITGASFFYYSYPAGGGMPELRNHWLYMRVLLGALGEGFFAVGFASSLTYMVRGNRARGDSHDALHDLTYRAVSMGFPLFTAGALVAGAMWAKQAWGSYWSWDPREVLSVAVWLVYAVYIHGRLVWRANAVMSAIIPMAGFLLSVFHTFRTRIFAGLYSYG